MIDKRQYTNYLFLIVAIFDYWLHYKILITDNCYYVALLIMSLLITALLGSSLNSLIHNYIINFAFRVFKISLYCYCILSLVLLFMSYTEPTITETAKLVSISTFRTDMISFDFNNKQYSTPYNISNYCDTKDYDNFIDSHKVEMRLKQPLPGAYIICDLVLSDKNE